MGRHRKAIAASSGVLLIALLEYAATTPDVERALELVVPHGVVPLVPVLFGGLATVAAVWKATNAQPSADADSVDPPAPADMAQQQAGNESAAPAPMPGPAAATPPDGPPPTAGPGALILDPQAPVAPFRDRGAPPATSLVQLLPPPAPDYH
jgi:hypothetical protein